MNRKTPTFAQMDNWLDARAMELTKGDTELGRSCAFKLGVLTARLSACFNDPIVLEAIRAEMLSFPEERQ